MTHETDMDLESTAQVGRVSGGRSARIAALLVVGVLVSVVWIGISGRSAPQPPQPTNPAVALEPTAAPGTLEPTPSATPVTPAIGQEIPDGPVAAVPNEVFGVYAEFGFDQYITILSELEPGHLVGRLRLPLPIAKPEGTFVFELFSSPSMTGGPVYIGDWPINVAPVVTDGPAVVVVDASLPARRSKIGSPLPVVNGFHLTVSAERDITTGELRIDVRIGPNRQIVGDDGLLGWASVATMTAMQPVVEKPVVVMYDRSRGRYNRCRWDLSPISAPPRPGTDEASC